MKLGDEVAVKDTPLYGIIVGRMRSSGGQELWILQLATDEHAELTSYPESVLTVQNAEARGRLIAEITAKCHAILGDVVPAHIIERLLAPLNFYTYLVLQEINAKTVQDIANERRRLDEQARARHARN